MNQLGAVVRHLRKLSANEDATTLRDQELLERFVTHRDETAFETLVARHGPMVQSVCQRVLADQHLVQDAFQATFLVLVRKAGSIGRRELLANWLYGVAHRTASRAKVESAKRRARESAVPPKHLTDPLAEISARELFAVLDKELAGMPPQYRGPLVLCYLEGRTRDEAAKQSGWSLATLARRLERGREMLRARLARRGLALSMTLFPVVLADATASACVPPLLAASTVEAAALIIGGSTLPAGMISSNVIALTEGVLKAMFFSKVKIITAVLLLVGLLGAGLGGKLVATDALPSPSRVAADEERVNKEPGNARREGATDADLLQGAWKVVRRVHDGVKVSEDPKAGVMRMYVTSDQIYVMVDKVFAGEAYAFTLDPKSKPATIDLLSFRGGTYNAIYRIERETLTLCRPIAPGIERPTKFTSEADSHLLLFELKRDPKAPKSDLEKVKAEQKLIVDRQPVTQSLMRIVLAMHEYHNAKESLPARAIFDGQDKPLLSWRVALLPYLGEKALYDRFRIDEPWDSDHNKRLLDEMPPVYGAGNETLYQVFVGEGTAFEGRKAAKLDDFRDGLGKTILLGMAAQSVPWTKPADLSCTADRPLPKLGAVFKEGFHVGVADGSVRFVPTNFNEKTLRALITIAGGEKESFNDLQGAEAKDDKKGEAK